MTHPPVVQRTLLDRLVGAFNPEAELRRVRARAMLNVMAGTRGYTGGKRGRKATMNHLPEGGSANADTLPDLPLLRARSRDLARNEPIATGAIATNKTHVIGSGLTVRASCDYQALGLSEEQARAWNAQADREFELAAETLDFSARMKFGLLQEMVFGSELESGDVFVIRRFRRRAGEVYGTKAQIIEADRVSNPNLAQDTDTLSGGIEFDADGAPVAIHVADRHPGDLYRRPSTWRRVPLRYNDGRRIVIHLAAFQRPDQARGIPYLAPVIEAIKSFGDYKDAEVRAAVVSAMFTVFVEHTGDEGSSPVSTGSEGARDDDTITLGSGAIVDLQPGESITTAAPSRPNPDFDGFAKSFLRLVGVALELPFELLVKHFTASYSASRAALEMAYHTFRKRRARFADDFCQEVRAWIIEEAILTGRLEAEGFVDDPARRRAWLRAEWTGPVRISLDPKKDAEADGIDLKNRVKTRQQIMTERTGGEFDVKADQIAREQDRLSTIPAEASGEPPSGPSTEDLQEELDDA
ncbi:phage portal protein [Oceaniradius stylonematis]|uniref:phage portal protein n=1 Tax=Oceaniradius stylonematis TaxID=2184161 RepID=UPI003B5B8AA9